MPRQARIDAPLALHHIIIEGIERKGIFCHHFGVDHKELLSGAKGSKVAQARAVIVDKNSLFWGRDIAKTGLGVKEKLTAAYCGRDKMPT